ncbi:MAG: hypothetical protein CMM07_25705 [Rhodopirellula sp.]|nr:hypothetical protein [Rhodopirellula sp.]
MNEVTTKDAPAFNIATGGLVEALVPQSFEDAFRLSRALAQAGDMVPKDFQGKPEAVLAAIMRGAELGLKPMQALSSISVINGRATVWGDALPALIQKAGHTIDVSVEGEGMEAIATATLTRSDTGKAITRTFSMKDAEAARLLEKNSPWKTYPKRMLSHRARGWAIRDGAADVLMGVQIAEEVQDYQPIKDVTPPAKRGFADMLNAARNKPQATEAELPREDKPTADPETTKDEIQDAQTLPDAPEKSEELTEDFLAGGKARLDGVHRAQCPHAPGGQDHDDWVAGWDAAPDTIDHSEGEGE